MAEEQIEGRNPVLEALRAWHPMIKIYLQKGELGKALRDVVRMASERKIPVHYVESHVLDRMATTRNHQGVIAVAAGWEYASLETIFQKAEERRELPFVLMLDGVEDPQNLGSIIRTAEATGVHGIIIPERRAAGLSPTVSRASAGAVEYVPVVRVTNLSRTIEELKKRGLWFTVAEMDGELEYDQADLTGPIGLVLGGEGGGVSRLVAEHCDQKVRLPMWGKVNSLNVAVATGVLLYEIRRQRKLKDG